MKKCITRHPASDNDNILVVLVGDDGKSHIGSFYAKNVQDDVLALLCTTYSCKTKPVDYYSVTHKK